MDKPNACFICNVCAKEGRICFLFWNISAIKVNYMCISRLRDKRNNYVACCYHTETCNWRADYKPNAIPLLTVTRYASLNLWQLWVIAENVCNNFGKSMFPFPNMAKNQLRLCRPPTMSLHLILKSNQVRCDRWVALKLVLLCMMTKHCVMWKTLYSEMHFMASS